MLPNASNGRLNLGCIQMMGIGLRHSWLVAMVMMAACAVSDLPPQGKANFCLTLNGSDPAMARPLTEPTEFGRGWAYAFTGEVVELGVTSGACSDRPASFVTIREDAKSFWTLHWNTIASDMKVYRPAFDVKVGTRVELDASYLRMQWSGDNATVTLVDDNGLVLAYRLDGGRLAPLAPEGAGFDISRGPKVDGDSGAGYGGAESSWSIYSMSFHADNHITVSPDTNKLLVVGGIEYWARNIHSYAIEKKGCFDCSGRSGGWLIWRRQRR